MKMFFQKISLITIIVVMMGMLIPFSFISADEHEVEGTQPPSTNTNTEPRDLGAPPGIGPEPNYPQGTANTEGQFTPLAGIPGLTDSNEDRTLADYLNILFRMAIGLGALLAVIKITIAGVKYMTTDSFGSKEEAKKDIQGALLGLLLMLSTVVILTVIYPDMLKLNFLRDAPGVNLNIEYRDPPFTPPASKDHGQTLDRDTIKELGCDDNKVVRTNSGAYKCASDLSSAPRADTPHAIISDYEVTDAAIHERVKNGYPDMNVAFVTDPARAPGGAVDEWAEICEGDEYNGDLESFRSGGGSYYACVTNSPVSYKDPEASGGGTEPNDAEPDENSIESSDAPTSDDGMAPYVGPGDSEPPPPPEPDDDTDSTEVSTQPDPDDEAVVQPSEPMTEPDTPEQQTSSEEGEGTENCEGLALGCRAGKAVEWFKSIF